MDTHLSVKKLIQYCQVKFNQYIEDKNSSFSTKEILTFKIDIQKINSLGL